jgi:hypothetical protein
MWFRINMLEELNILELGSLGGQNRTACRRKSVIFHALAANLLKTGKKMCESLRAGAWGTPFGTREGQEGHG